MEHMRFTSDGLVLTIEQSKIDQQGAGQVIALPYGSNRLTCPVRSMQAWLEGSGITSGPVFRRMDQHGNLYERLTAQSVRLIVKKNCQKAGLLSLENLYMYKKGLPLQLKVEMAVLNI